MTRWTFNVGLFVATLVVVIVLGRILDPPDEDGLAWFGSFLGALIVFAFYTLPTLVVYLLIVAALARRSPPPAARLAAVALAPIAFFILVFPEDVDPAERIVAYILPSLLFGALVRLPPRAVKA